MATLTVKAKRAPEEAIVPAEKVRQPVRRADPSKRDRSLEANRLAKSIRQNKTPDSDERRKKASAEKTGAEKSRQRNHRYDGSLHQADNTNGLAQNDNEKTAVEAFKHRAILRSEYPSRDRNSKPSSPTRQANSAEFSESAKSSTRAYTDREGAYRNPPRRAGKVRDGFVASEFDKNRTGKNTADKPKPVNSTELPRLSKRMAELGLCSRREADEWIENGWVKVDGVIIDTLGTRIKPDAEIVISGYAREHQAENVTILLHKPVGYVSGQAEDGYEPAIVLVHPDNQWPEDPSLLQKNPKQFERRFLKGLAPAGRLDIDSTGLLVLTQDGRIARQLIGDNSTIEKEYLVRVEGSLSEADLAKLNFGLSLDGEKLKPAKVSWQNEHQLRFVLREGKKRQIRRMCEMVGLTVVGLKRIRIGSVLLSKLPVGNWRYLKEGERF